MPKIAPTQSNEKSSLKQRRRLFLSTRFLVAIVLSLSYTGLSVATMNLAQAMVCMVHQPSENPDELQRLISRRDMSDAVQNHHSIQENSTATTILCSEKLAPDSDVHVTSCNPLTLRWTPEQQGAIYAAQNIGSLFILLAGWQADRLNGKWTIATSLTLLIVSNALIPSVAYTSPWLVFVFRIVTGVGDALLGPSASSMITRWFPPKERSFAVGFVTGGRQLGTLLIQPIGGLFCQHSATFGWSAIFYLSSIICAAILIVWLFLAADKPSKHFCISLEEESYIARKVDEEKLGKRIHRGNPPWGKLARCVPLYVAVAALVCHEYPLVIMLQLLPKYFSEVLGFSNVVNGIVSSLPSVVLFISKTVSCILASLFTSSKPPLLGSTACCKLFNLIGSLGLAICVGVVPLLGGSPTAAVVVLCLANAFAGLHTPGVITALVQIAPAYTGIVNGIAFATVAVFSIFNKMLSNFIVTSGSASEWALVFEISAIVAFLPVVFFTYWGSADIQPWASTNGYTPKESEPRSEATTVVTSTDSTLDTCSIFLSHDFPSS